MLQKLNQQFEAFVVEEGVFRYVDFLHEEKQITIFFECLAKGFEVLKIKCGVE